MPIIACSACGKKLSVPDQFHNKRFKCPGCQSIISFELEAIPKNIEKNQNNKTTAGSDSPIKTNNEEKFNLPQGKLRKKLQGSWVEMEIKTKCIRTFIGFVVVLVSLIAIVGFKYRYVINYIIGPNEMAQIELENLNEQKGFGNKFILVRGKEVVLSSAHQIDIITSKRSGSQREAKYVYKELLVGEKWLLVKNLDEGTLNAKGNLIPFDDDFLKYTFNHPIIGPWGKKYYPYYLDNSWYRLNGHIFLGVIIVNILLLYFVGGEALAIFSDISKSPLAKKIIETKTPRLIADEIENNAQNPLISIGSWRLSQKYFIYNSFFFFDVYFPSSFLKAEKIVLDERDWKFKKKCKIIIDVKGGEKIEIEGSGKSIDKVEKLAVDLITQNNKFKQ